MIRPLCSFLTARLQTLAIVLVYLSLSNLASGACDTPVSGNWYVISANVGGGGGNYNVTFPEQVFCDGACEFLSPNFAAHAQLIIAATRASHGRILSNPTPLDGSRSPMCFQMHEPDGTDQGSCGAGWSIALNMFCPTGYRRDGTFGGAVCHLEDPNLEQCPVSQSLEDQEGLGCDKNHNAEAQIGNPCNAGNGNKYLVEMDHTASADSPSIIRHYNSQFSRDIGFGYGWTSSFHKQREVTGRSSVMRRADGKGEIFTRNFTGWTPNQSSSFSLFEDAAGYTLLSKDGSTERYDRRGRIVAETAYGRTTTYNYDADGHLQTVVGPFGHTFSFFHQDGHISRITEPSGQSHSYQYDASDNLTRVTYPDGRFRTYHYENTAYPHHLTGITDERGIRFATYAYNANGKAAATEHAGGHGRFTLTYDSDTQTTVQDAAGASSVLEFNRVLAQGAGSGARDLIRKTSVADGKHIVQTFDNRRLTRRTDEENRVTTYSYNDTNQKTSITEAADTPQARTARFQYLAPDVELPTLVQRPSIFPGAMATLSIDYDADRNPILITKSGYTPDGDPVSRAIALSYNAAGQVVSIDGPRTDVVDVTTLSYYTCTSGEACGQLRSITNALGHVTMFDAYDANGRLVKMTDQNGVQISYVYDDRGRVITLAQASPEGGVRTTSYAYDAAGQIISVTTPSRIVLTYAYSAAQKLTRITDSLGNRIDYTYDLRGNKTGESTYDVGGALVRQVTLTYDLRNRVSSINQGGSITQLIHDAVGNVTEETDPKNNLSTSHSFDVLNRLIQTVDAIGGTTVYGHDVSDRVSRVMAPNNATTQYRYDDLDNLRQEISPDRGITTYTYDAAGNVLTKTDARGIEASYGYDALNRLIAIGYPGTGEDVAFAYDTGTHCDSGIGRLCQVTDASGLSRYAYDGFGNIIAKQKTELGITYTTQYTYDADDRVMSIIYPDRRVVSYARDGLRRITSITATINGNHRTITRGRTYRPDGLLLSQTYGNNLTESRIYDTQGRLTYQSLSSVGTRFYGYDANSNVTRLQSLLRSSDYTYDSLNRLIGDHVTSTPASSIGFAYDGNGNRLSDTLANYSYIANSNRLSYIGSSPVIHDAAGNLLAQGSRNYTYDGGGKLIQARDNDQLLATYTYNHLGQRTRKTTPIGVTVYHYDQEGNLIAETTGTGTPWRAYVYTDATPIAQIQKNGANDVLSYLHVDHLETPRFATNASRAVVWRWEGRACGDMAPTGSITMNFRFPGQYFDQETALHYNWNRYFDPRTCRYTTSDPIGLVGGSNSYLYSANNPLRFVDRNGLFLGALLGKLLGPIFGKTPQEAAYGGKLLDTAISAIAGDMPNCVDINGKPVETTVLRNVLGGIGGLSSISLSASTTVGLYGAGATIGSVTGSVALPLLLAGYGGVETGSAFNGLYEEARGNSLGSDIHDLFTHGSLFEYKQSGCECQR